MKKRKLKVKKKKPEIIKIPKDNIEELKNYYDIGLSKFRYKFIPKELIPKEIPSLVYYIDSIYGNMMVGLVKKINEKKHYLEIKEINTKFEHIGYYDFDQVMLVPPGSKDFKKFERYIK